MKVKDAYLNLSTGGQRPPQAPDQHYGIGVGGDKVVAQQPTRIGQGELRLLHFATGFRILIISCIKVETPGHARQEQGYCQRDGLSGKRNIVQLPEIHAVGGDQNLSQYSAQELSTQNGGSRVPGDDLIPLLVHLGIDVGVVGHLGGGKCAEKDLCHLQPPQGP